MTPVAQFIRRLDTPSVRLVVKRLLQAIPVMWGATFLTFMLLNLLPGGTAAAIVQGLGVDPSAVKALEARLHLNEPFFTRYWHWLSSTVTGHLGASLASGQPVAQILAKRLPVTAEMALIALVASVVLSICVALLAVRRPFGIADRISMTVSAFGLAVPGFVLALVLILIFAVHLHWFPSLGYTYLTDGVGKNLRSLVLPCVTLAFPLFCNYTRVLRADLLDQLNGEDYVITARAKGLKFRRVLMRHALRNSLFSLLTIVGLNLGVLFGGTVIIEQIFDIPGIGQELVQAVQLEDVTVVEGVVLVLVAAVVVASILTDLVYALLDPRIRYGRPSS